MLSGDSDRPSVLSSSRADSCCSFNFCFICFFFRGGGVGCGSFSSSAIGLDDFCTRVGLASSLDVLSDRLATGIGGVASGGVPSLLWLCRAAGTGLCPSILLVLFLLIGIGAWTSCE